MIKGKLLKISKDQFREEECSYENIDFYGKVLLNANDYLNDLLLYGLYELENIEIVDSTPIVHLYKENQTKISQQWLWGKGFTSTYLIDKDNIDRSNIEDKIKDKYFDLIIYGSPYRCLDYYELISSIYPANRIFLIDGNDLTDVHSLSIKHPYFKRELTSDKFIPIHFAIPECKITNNKLEKIQGEALNQALGSCRLITVTKENTTIVDGKGGAEKLEQRAEELKQQIISNCKGNIFTSFGDYQVRETKTIDGWKLMGDLRFGDRLASVDGQFSMVTGIYPQGIKQIYKVTLSDGREAECCDEHLWRVMYRDWSEPRVINTKRLMEMLQCVRYKNRLWIDPVSGDFGHSNALPIHPWVLGALLGDGTLALSHKSVSFSTKSPELVERMNMLAGYEMEMVHTGAYDWRIVSKERIAANGARQYVSKNYFRAALEDVGVLGCRSFDKFIPTTYLEANRNSRLALFQGLMDTDGWIEKWGSIRFCTASKQLSEDVATLARSLGGFCSIATKQSSYTYLGEKKQGRLTYVLNMSFEAGFQAFSLPEKKERLRASWDRQRRLTFRNIEPSRVTQAQCISVSHPQRTYITNDYVVTHNTAFALNIAENVALAEGLPVVVFSMEMSGEQLASRLLGSVGRVDQGRMRTGKLQDDEWPRVTDAIARLSNTQILIDETGSLSSLELRARARRIARNFGGTLGLVVIDYLQLMSGSGSENRATEISEISRSLKSLAKELQCPVVALSQLNRGLEQRPNKRPIMSDLRESGAIEQDADLIMFIYRDEVYHPDTTTDKGVAEIIIGKQRNGPIGTVRLSWQGPFTKFDNLAMGSIGYSSGGYEPF